MTTEIRLTELASEIIALNGSDKEINFKAGSDYQGDLCLSWDGDKFQANLVIYSDPSTSFGSYFEPPETDWDMEEVNFEAVKIQDVADWLKNDWRFLLEQK